VRSLGSNEFLLRAFVSPVHPNQIAFALDNHVHKIQDNQFELGGEQLPIDEIFFTNTG